MVPKIQIFSQLYYYITYITLLICIFALSIILDILTCLAQAIYYSTFWYLLTRLSLKTNYFTTVGFAIAFDFREIYSSLQPYDIFPQKWLSHHPWYRLALPIRFSSKALLVVTSVTSIVIIFISWGSKYAPLWPQLNALGTFPEPLPPVTPRHRSSVESLDSLWLWRIISGEHNIRSISPMRKSVRTFTLAQPSEVGVGGPF